MESINGKTKVCGLIGNPVEHTVSPMIHNTLAGMTEKNLVYTPFFVKEGYLCDAIKGAYALDVVGLNITVPYKSEVLQYAVEVDKLAAQIGAVNTLVRTVDGYKGYNTDMPGLYRAMSSENIKIKNESIIILGAGGAARAAAFMCAEAGAACIYILNRTIEKAKTVAKEVNNCYGENTVRSLLLSEYEALPNRKYLAIQATSVGLFPHVNDAVILDKEFYDKIHTGYDLIYRPAKTKFMSLVERSGGKVYHGLKMLLYQGIIAYELWNDISVTQDMALHVYERMKEEMDVR